MPDRYMFGYHIAQQSSGRLWCFLYEDIGESIRTNKETYRIVPIMYNYKDDHIGGYVLRNGQTAVAEKLSPNIQQTFVGVMTGRFDNSIFTKEEKISFMQGFLKFFASSLTTLFAVTPVIKTEDAFCRLEISVGDFPFRFSFPKRQPTFQDEALEIGQTSKIYI